MIEPIPFAGCIEIEEEMSLQEAALQLANELELSAKRAEDHGTIATRSTKAADLLRQQAKRIAELERKHQEEFDYVESLLKDQKK